jgi:hypothetical protein
MDRVVQDVIEQDMANSNYALNQHRGDLKYHNDEIEVATRRIKVLTKRIKILKTALEEGGDA